jgi:3-oxoacyl-[acyl-carrier protein] reductase
MSSSRPLALIIGGSRGIGKSTALRLAESGYDIFLTYHKNLEAAESVRAEILKRGVTCDLAGFNVANTQETDDALKKVMDERAPDVVVYNSGIARDNLLVMMNADEWNDVISTNLNGFYNVMRSALFPMLREKRGRIVAVSSTSGEIGQAGQVNYSASKAGLIGAAKALAREVGKKNIFVNVVAPGVIETDMTADLPLDKLKPLIPLQRFGNVEDVSAVIHFLCTEKNMYIHGQVIGINGGLAT